jgi:hypothetical protein
LCTFRAPLPETAAAAAAEERWQQEQSITGAIIVSRASEAVKVDSQWGRSSTTTDVDVLRRINHRRQRRQLNRINRFVIVVLSEADALLIMRDRHHQLPAIASSVGSNHEL